MYSRYRPDLLDAKRAVEEARRKRKPNSTHEKEVRASKEKKRRAAEDQRQRHERRKWWEARVKEARSWSAHEETKHQEFESEVFRQWYESTYCRPVPFSRLDDSNWVFEALDEWQLDTGRRPLDEHEEYTRLDAGIVTAYPSGDYSTSKGVDLDDDEDAYIEELVEQARDRDRETLRRIEGDRNNLRRAMPSWAWDGICEVYTRCENERIETGAEYEVEHIVPLLRDDDKRRRPKACGLHCAANLRIVKRRQTD